MNEELTKSLTDLIDETLFELEELRKSRFSASEIKIEGPGDGIAGKPSDGKLDASKAEDKKEDDKKDKDDDKEMDKGENRDAAAKAEKCEKCGKSPCECKKDEDKSMDKAEDKKKDDGKDKEDKKDEDDKGGEKHEAEEKKAIGKLANLAGMKKSEEEEKKPEELSPLMKSFVEERVKPLEDKLSSILDLVHKIADQPVASKGATARTQPLLKSADDVEPLTKSQIASKLWELKKSGSTPVDSLDVTKAEMGQDLETIVKKYKLS